jgi:hypothetical protein
MDMLTKLHNGLPACEVLFDQHGKVVTRAQLARTGERAVALELRGRPLDAQHAADATRSHRIRRSWNLPYHTALAFNYPHMPDQHKELVRFDEVGIMQPGAVELLGRALREPCTAINQAVAWLKKPDLTHEEFEQAGNGTSLKACNMAVGFIANVATGGTAGAVAAGGYLLEMSAKLVQGKDILSEQDILDAPMPVLPGRGLDQSSVTRSGGKKTKTNAQQPPLSPPKRPGHVDGEHGAKPQHTPGAPADGTGQGVHYAKVGGHREALRKIRDGYLEAYDPAQPQAPGIPVVRRNGKFLFHIDERYIATPQERLSAPNAEGIRTAGGKNYVSIGQHNYRVFQDPVNRKMAPDAQHTLWRIFDETQHPNEWGRIPNQHTVPVVYHPQKGQWRVADMRLRGGNPLTTSRELIAVGETSFEVTHTTAVELADAQRREARRMLSPSHWKSDSDALLYDAGYRKAYQTVFFHELSGLERRALRNWSATEERGARYKAGEEPIEGGVNYALNEALARGDYDWRSDPVLETQYYALQSALRRLPSAPQPARLLRIADVPPSYPKQLAVGDIVTNAPTFMSASSKSELAEISIGHRANGDVGAEKRAMLAFYSIESLSAKPFIQGISAKSGVEYEGEFLFRPDSRFKVEAISVAKDASGQAKTRVLIQLKELPYDASEAFVEAKNIHTGQMQRVYAPDSNPSPGERAAQQTSERQEAELEPHAGPSGANAGLSDASLQGVKTPRQSRVTADGQYRIDYFTSAQASPKQLDRILSFESWSAEIDGFTSYRREANQVQRRLPEDERSALEKWVADHGSDSSDEIPYFDVQTAFDNFDRSAMRRRADLESGLSKMPAVPAKLLRVASVPVDAAGQTVYSTQIGAGDFVSNGNRFLSASHDNTYALDNDNVDAHEALVYYEIDSRSARLLPDTVGNGGEHEWLFMPNRVFAVDGIAVRNPAGASNEPQRIAVKLREVDAASFSGPIKHIITGEPCTAAGSEFERKSQDINQRI